MKLRAVGASVAVVTMLAGCSGGNKEPSVSKEAPSTTTSSKEATSTTTSTEFRFLENGGDSDYFQAVNCQTNVKRIGSVSLTNPDGDIVKLTLGATDQDPRQSDAQKVHFIGGATIFAVGNEIYTVASSADVVTTQADLNDGDYSREIPIGEQYQVRISLSQAGMAQIECVYVQV